MSKTTLVNKILPLSSLVLIAGGLVFLGIVTWNYIKPSPPPYYYKLVGDGDAKTYPELGLDKEENLRNVAVRKYEIRISGIEESLAEFYVGKPDSDQPVLLEWRNKLTEPVITLTSKMKEVVTLAGAVKKHASVDAKILAWWDTSRRLDLLTEKQTVFGQNFAMPVLIPNIWLGSKNTVLQLERDFWKIPTEKHSAERLKTFVDILLSDEVVGVARLRQLAGGSDAYLILHVSDLYKIGAMAPDRFSVGYQDFAKVGDLHAMAKRIKSWIHEEGHKAFTVLPTGDNSVRVYFLGNEISKEALISRLLPFDTSNPFKLNGMKVVYKNSGYWVYRIFATKAAASLSGQ